jgi:ABC-2 type transport system ATP-binding protein
VPRETLEGYEGFRGLEGLTASFEVERGAVREFSRKALDGLPVVDLTIEEIPLEEGIAELYRSEVIGG